MELTLGIVAVVNTIGYLAVLYAFRASFRELRTATWWFAMGFAILAGAIILRGLYWDVAFPLIRHYRPEFIDRWLEITGGRSINLVFSLMKMVAFFCALKCREAMIPADERWLWPWWKAWMHPKPLKLLPWR